MPNAAAGHLDSGQYRVQRDAPVWRLALRLLSRTTTRMAAVDRPLYRTTPRGYSHVETIPALPGCFETSSGTDDAKRPSRGQTAVSVRARPHRAQCCARTSRGFQSTGCATARVVNWLQEFGLQLPNSFGLPHTHCERVRTRTRLDSSSPTANPTTLAARTTWLTLATRYTLSPAKWI